MNCLSVKSHVFLKIDYFVFSSDFFLLFSLCPFPLTNHLHIVVLQMVSLSNQVSFIFLQLKPAPLHAPLSLGIFRSSAQHLLRLLFSQLQNFYLVLLSRLIFYLVEIAFVSLFVAFFISLNILKMLKFISF